MSTNDLIDRRIQDGGDPVTASSSRSRRAYTLAPGVNRIATLRALLDDYDVQYRPAGKLAPHESVLAWGMRPSALRAQRYAAQRGMRVLHIEDGFLRSVGLGRDDPPLSVVLDDQGLYLDASRPSGLETAIRQDLNGAEQHRAYALVQSWRNGRVSKYNHSRDFVGEVPAGSILVVDQTRGDASIAYGQADVSSFTRMLEAALREHPQDTILLKVHPDVVAGRKRGHYDLAALRATPRVRILNTDAHPASLLDRVSAVYVVTSQLGFEALLWDVPVRVFGMPFYAGWGLTRDELSAPARRRPVSLPQLVHGTLIDYCRYLDPETGRRCEVETVLAWMALQRRMRARFGTQVEAVGFSGWKKGFVRDFFSGSKVRFLRRIPDAPSGRTIAVWGCKQDGRLAAAAFSDGVVRVEDGFLRSVGLGADLTRPLSWVQDDVGIYYDATRASRLERLLRETEFDAHLMARAGRLRQAICDAGITKYNVGGPVQWAAPAGRRVILVPGQVETDASIQYGSAHIRSNMALLRAVREAEPDAYLVYKPHPDVFARLRRPGQGEAQAGQWCDEVLGPLPFAQLLGAVDEVHVLTSLAGFEALLRGKPVVSYGQPFYAGWGLTRDVRMPDAVLGRRGRLLELDQLVAAALILYPTYVSRVTHRYTTPEQVLRELIEWRASPGVARWRHWIARLFREA